MTAEEVLNTVRPGMPERRRVHLRVEHPKIARLSRSASTVALPHPGGKDVL